MKKIWMNIVETFTDFLVNTIEEEGTNFVETFAKFEDFYGLCKSLC